MLKSGIPLKVKVVSERLAHANTQITSDIYLHVLESMDQEAAAKMGALLHR